MTTYTDNGQEYTYDPAWVKEKCSDCGSLFPDPEDNYRQRGNYCSKCNAKYIRGNATYEGD